MASVELSFELRQPLPSRLMLEALKIWAGFADPPKSLIAFALSRMQLRILPGGKWSRCFTYRQALEMWQEAE